MKKIVEFNIMKNKAGNIILKLSLTFILIITPINISIDKPAAEINNIGR